VDDGGFDFRGTDQQREFIWSQTVWVEVTPVTGALNLTHPNVVTKVGTAGQIVEGGITDESAGNSDRVHITAAGDIGLAIPSPSGSVHARRADGGYQFVLERTGSNAHVYGLAISSGTGALLINDLVVPAVRLGLTAAGNLGLGFETSSYQLQLTLDSAAKPGTSSWTVPSDVRLKENIEPVTDDSLAILGALNWVRYEYNGQGNTPRGLKAVGLSAQELSTHLPEAVRSVKARLSESNAEESDVLSIDYHHILVHSARAIQQLAAEVKSLKAILQSKAT
jgi:hypothetical protein